MYYVAHIYSSTYDRFAESNTDSFVRISIYKRPNGKGGLKIMGLIIDELYEGASYELQTSHGKVELVHMIIDTVSFVSTCLVKVICVLRRGWIDYLVYSIVAMRYGYSFIQVIVAALVYTSLVPPTPWPGPREF